MYDPHTLAKILAIKRHMQMQSGASLTPKPLHMGNHPIGLANPNPSPVDTPAPSAPFPGSTPVKAVEFHPSGEMKGIQFHAPEQPKMPGESKFMKLKI